MDAVTRAVQRGGERMSMEEANKQELIPLSDVIDWGQGYDDTIIELLKAFQKFRDGYYSLINYGDDWWKQFNQGTDFDQIMARQWDLIDANDFMNCIEKMTIAIAGTYVQFDKFVDGVVKAYDSGKGYRHKEKEASGMTISDLLDKKTRGIFTDDEILKCGLIALDAKNGKILFDTEKNKREYIEQYKTGKVISLWADMRQRNGAWNNYFVPVIKCYVSHDSWKEGEQNDYVN